MTASQLDVPRMESSVLWLSTYFQNVNGRWSVTLKALHFVSLVAVFAFSFLVNQFQFYWLIHFVLRGACNNTQYHVLYILSYDSRSHI